VYSYFFAAVAVRTPITRASPKPSPKPSPNPVTRASPDANPNANQVRNGIVAANRSGFVQPFTRKLDGGGAIEHVINGVGGSVSAAGQGSYVCHAES
jgi:hypothetical protein